MTRTDLAELEQWRNRAATDRNWSRGSEVDLLGQIIDRLAAAMRKMEQDGEKPADCSRDPKSCPENEGRGCYCADVAREQDSAATGAQGEAVAWVLFDKDSMLPVTASHPYAVEPAPWIRELAARDLRAVWCRVSTAPAPTGVTDEPDGFALVPREYTDAMLAAGIAQLNAVRNALGEFLSDETLCGVVFDGMVSARHVEAALAAEQKVSK